MKLCEATLGVLLSMIWLAAAPPASAQDASEDLSALIGVLGEVLESAGGGNDASGDLGSTPSALDEGAPGTTPIPPPSGSYSSVCMRDGEKYEHEIYRQAIAENVQQHYEAPLTVSWHQARQQIFARCAAADPNAQSEINRSQREIDDANNACASGNGYKCDGIEDAQSQRWLDIALAEAGQATNDPNYSADYGSVSTPRQQQATGNSPSPQQQMMVADETACIADLNKVAASLATVNKRHASEAVVLSEALMWATGKSMKIVKAKCPQTLVYKEKYKEFKKTRADTEQTCNQISTTKCEPRLPKG